MRSSEHAVIGAVAGAAAIPALARGRSLPAKLALWTYGLALSVFIDLDHFAIAWLKTGDWSYLRRAVADPIWAFTHQEEVFPDVEMTLERLASHVVIGGALAALLGPVDRALAAFSTGIVCVHVLADVVYEARTWLTAWSP